MSNNETLFLLVDSGASVSIFTESKVYNHPINYNESCSIKGITTEEIITLGTATTTLTLEDNSTLNHSFQIVPKCFDLGVDGIIGRDFLMKFRAIIDYSTYMLQINSKFTTMIPLYDQINDSFIIPARSEVIRRLKLKYSEPTLILSQEVANGVFISNSIVDENCLVKFVNTNLYDKKIKNFVPKSLPLRNYIIIKTPEYRNLKKIYTIHSNNVFIQNLPERIEQLKSEIDLSNVSVDYVDNIWSLCKEFHDIFCLSHDALTTNNFYTQKIIVTNDEPVFTKNYRIPHAHKDVISNQVKNMLIENVIEHSFSPYNSPLLLVPKKNSKDINGWRMVVDYRQVNKKVVSDVFPLPRIDEILDQLGRAKWFTILDLKSGFHQIQIDKESRGITAFSTAEGHFQFKRLPFGLKVAPNSFQRMMNIAMSGLTPESCFLYIDDLVVFGCSVNHHNSNLRKVFSTLRKFNLKLNPAKCQFLQNCLTYLGHEISDKGIRPDTAKFSVIKNYPEPKNADEVRRFVAFCNYYRRFVENFAEIVAPLNKLQRKGEPFVWTTSCRDAFELLKRKLVSPPILQYPDFSKEFRLTCDASDIACGAVLSQLHNGEDLPICYASKAFQKADKHKPPAIKECIAIHWAIDYFKAYLTGTKFKVFTDHRPLVYLFSMKNPSSKLTRMRLDLETYDFEIEYLKGKHNVCADALSRIPVNCDTLKSLERINVVTRSMTRRNQAVPEPEPDQLPTVPVHVYTPISHNSIRKFVNLNISLFPNSPSNRNDLEENKNGIKLLISFPEANLTTSALEHSLKFLEQCCAQINIFKLKISEDQDFFKVFPAGAFKNLGNSILNKIKIAIFPVRINLTDDNEIDELIKNLHSSLLGGHVGVSRLLKKISEKYTFSNMISRIKNIVLNCISCKKVKHTKNHQEFAQVTDTPSTSFQTISMDIVGPLRRSLIGNRFVLTIQDELTKLITLVPTANKEAKTISRAFVHNYVLQFGAVDKIKTDLGTEFMNSIFRDVTEALRLNHAHSTPYHPQTISVERNHRSLNEFLRAYINDELDDWDEFTKYFEFCYNTTPCRATGFTPFELTYGKVARLPTDLKSSTEPMYNIDDFAKEMKYKLSTAQRSAHLLLHRDKLSRKLSLDSQMKNYYNFKLGDTVALKIFNQHKLEPLKDGPYVIVQMDAANATIQRQSDGSEKIVHRNLLTPF